MYRSRTPKYLAEQNTAAPSPELSAPVSTPESSVSTALSQEGSAYRLYSADEYAAQSNKRRLLFFHASWCPTCKVANASIEKNLASIPSDLVIFRVDYDKESELKKKYDITYQHTFVLVDKDGNELKKWNGGDFEAIKQRLQ